MFHTIRRVFRLGASERRLAARAIAWLVVADIGLRVRGFPAIGKALDHIPTRGKGRRASAAECADAMRRAARVYPHARCLARALAAAALLRREGVASVLSIGVGFDRGMFEAHAWLESAGIVVTGTGALADGQPLVRQPILPAR